MKAIRIHAVGIVLFFSLSVLAVAKQAFNGEASLLINNQTNTTLYTDTWLLSGADARMEASPSTVASKASPANIKAGNLVPCDPDSMDPIPVFGLSVGTNSEPSDIDCIYDVLLEPSLFQCVYLTKVNLIWQFPNAEMNCPEQPDDNGVMTFGD
ncbi:MAG: hypothetical protein COV52_10345 [Gammaproteobacteria bacterium CG11_big_fil_rev_8_21_14_0_20_46_22]|nr:MAG: hypothetical protein COW05_09570 [Gammaproteobacteria bacterium CG12_big_fil_rev_8_21_14_0_65_46_12]PIR10096.1 MAG: hypothetical protein COV52_10345 [Gammaproteobacteria bacterium CG11_big_fil_rev_8_21_14_0_20_46_22]